MQAQLEPSARAALQGLELDGVEAASLAQAMAGLFAEALEQFMLRSQILPGVLAAVDPITTQGQTIGPGLLMPPPVGGPDREALLAIASAKLEAAQLDGEALEAWADVLAHTCEHGLLLLCTTVMMKDKLSVAGMVTSAPGELG